MTIEQLRCFVTAAAVKSFSQAPELEFTTQSSISKKIKQLETQLGIMLFTRHNRKIEITEAGKLLVGDAKKLLNHIEKFEESAKRISLMGRKRIRITCLPFIAQHNLSTIFQQFMDKYPDVLIEVNVVEEGELIENLITDNGDIFLLRENTAMDNEFAKEVVFYDKMALFVAKNHPLSQNYAVSISQLSEESFILLPIDSGFYKLCMQCCLAAGFMPNVKNTTHRIDYILSQVSTGVAVSLLPYSNIKCFKLKNIKVLPIRPKIECNVVAVFPKDVNKKTNKALCKQLVAFMQSWDS